MLKDAVPLADCRRALVIKLRHHGDVLLATPVLAALKAAAPALEIDALVYDDTAPMLEGNPALAQLHTVGRSWRGAGLTARLAAEFGREVFAIPGSLHNALSKGCHKLIQDGAKLVEHTTDILVELSPQLGHAISLETVDTNESQSDSMPIALRRCLDHAPTTFDSLLECSGLTTGELSSMLLHLELQGKIEALPHRSGIK